MNFNSSKLLWSGLTLVVAVPTFLALFGLDGGNAVAAVGAVLMVVGCLVLIFKE